MFSPFVNIYEYLSSNKNFLKELQRFFSCALKPVTSKENLIDKKYDDTSSCNIIKSSNYDFLNNKGIDVTKK
jgi:hypothetical protein